MFSDNGGPSQSEFYLQRIDALHTEAKRLRRELQSEKARADAADSRGAELEAELTELRMGLESQIDSIRTGADFHEPDVRTLIRRIAYDLAAMLTPTAELESIGLRKMMADSARLDWLETQREAYGFEEVHEGNRWVIDGPFRTARDAMDAAMEVSHDPA